MSGLSKASQEKRNDVGGILGYIAAPASTMADLCTLEEQEMVVISTGVIVTCLLDRSRLDHHWELTSTSIAVEDAGCQWYLVYRVFLNIHELKPACLNLSLESAQVTSLIMIRNTLFPGPLKTLLTSPRTPHLPLFSLA